MNQEEVKKVDGQKKPLRTFGEDDLNAHHAKPVIGTGMTKAAPIKKVDRAIRRAEEGNQASADKKDADASAQSKAADGARMKSTQSRNPQSEARKTISPQTARAVKVAATQPLKSMSESDADASAQKSGEESTEAKNTEIKKNAAKKADSKKVDVRRSDAKKPDVKKAEAGKSASGKSKKSKRKKKKQKRGAGETFIRIGRGIRSGSVSVQRYVKGGMTWFDRFVSGEANLTPPKGDVMLGKLGEKLAWIKKMGFSSFIIGSILLMAVILTFFNNTSIQVENVTVSIAGLSSDLEGYTICLISDLHGREFGTEQATLLRAINGEDYDMMLITGDMVGADEDPKPFYDLLEGLSGSKPVYFIAGDSDPGPLRDEPNVVEGTLEEYVLEDWVLGAISRGAIYLDSPESLTVDDSVIWLTPESMLNVESSSTVSALNKQAYQETNEVLEGLDIGYKSLPFTSYRQQNMTQLQESILEMETTDLHISVAHIPPDSAPRVSDGSDGYLPTVDLIVAGHYCGGVWQLPVIGAVYIPSVEAPRHGWFPSQDEVEGLRMLGSVNMYVSGGLGVTDQIYLPDFRFNNQPKVTLLHLTAKLTDDLLGLTD